MSGGSWDYFYSRVREAGDRLQHDSHPLRRALGVHLVLVAEALHDIEWVDSSDYGKGDEEEAIKKVLGAAAVPMALAEIQKDAERLLRQVLELTTVRP